MSKVYLDHNATTPVAASIREELPKLIEVWGNPSSIHWLGRGPKNILRETRKAFAEAVGASPLEIIFNSGGSEANNTVIKGIFDQTSSEPQSKVFGRNHFMCSAVEHPSVLRTFMFLRERGADVDIIPVNRQGQLDLDFLKERLSERTALVSVMAANNETGTVFPIKEITQLVKAKGAYMHTDAVQALGKIPVQLNDWGVDFASFSAHKVYSLKGTGVLYARKGSHVTPLIHGGGQERYRRGGTENLLGIAALGVVVPEIKKTAEQSEMLSSLRDYFEKRVLAEISEVQVTAGESLRLPNTSSLVLQGCDGETMLMNLDIQGFAVSTGAACSSGNPEPSPVLLAIGLSRAEAQNSLRVTLGWHTTRQEIDLFIEALKETVLRLRTIEKEMMEKTDVF
ncbi:MAG: cysteine desulfurase family protein [Bdellovibrionia bacterium]